MMVWKRRLLLNMVIFGIYVKFLGGTPRKINIEPENDGLVQMIFLYKRVILRFEPLIVRGVGN